MNSEFHYWITGFLAVKAGLPLADAALIAASAQLVDDRTQRIRLAGAGELIATQDLASLGGEEAARIRAAFHFVPGDRAAASAKRRDGRAGEGVVTPDSPLAKALLIDALKSDDRYRIGIALHAYADTWAHQNFSGSADPANAFAADDPVPPVGHAPALRAPDRLNEIWTDPRLETPDDAVDNRLRFASAALKIYKYLATYARRPFDDAELVLVELETLWGERALRTRDEREAAYARASGLRPWSAAAWLDSAGLAGAGYWSDRPELDGVDEKWRKLGRRGEDWLVGKLGKSVEAGPAFSGSDLDLWNRAAGGHMAAFLSRL
jgi:hypothetical protein